MSIFFSLNLLPWFLLNCGALAVAANPSLFSKEVLHINGLHPFAHGNNQLPSTLCPYSVTMVIEQCMFWMDKKCGECGQLLHTQQRLVIEERTMENTSESVTLFSPVLSTQKPKNNQPEGTHYPLSSNYISGYINARKTMWNGMVTSNAAILTTSLGTETIVTNTFTLSASLTC